MFFHMLEENRSNLYTWTGIKQSSAAKGLIKVPLKWSERYNNLLLLSTYKVILTGHTILIYLF